MEYKINEDYTIQLNDYISQLKTSLNNYKKSYVQFKVYGTSEQEQIYNNDKDNVTRVLNNIFLLKNNILKEISNLSTELNEKSGSLNNYDAIVDNQENKLEILTDINNATNVREKDFEHLLHDEYVTTALYSLGLVGAISLFYYNF